MAATAGTQLHVNGTTPSTADLEGLEYEKILRLRDQIFSGNHPRLKVPQHAIRKVTPRSVQTPPLSSSQQPVDVSASSNLTVPGLSHANGVSQAQPHLSPFTSSSPAGSRAPAPKATSSEIDPIFLTKSDDLVRAEVQLQRQRIERSLREQLDQKRIEARQKTSTAEAKPDFDISDVFTRALEVVKPVATSEVQVTNRNASASDSFDENSFYSSKAPDSTPRHGDDRQHSPVPEHQMQPMDIDYLDADGHLDHHVQESRQINLPDRDMMTGQNSSARPPPNLNIRHASRQDMTSHQAPPYFDARDVEDLEDEPEYSPPAPTLPPTGRKFSNNGARDGGLDPRRQPQRRQSDRYQNGRRNESPPAADVRIVRNHITSPIAPQPFRVSPLALAKVPPPAQNRRNNRHDQNFYSYGMVPESVRTSPEMPAQPLSAKKRRRLEGGRKDRQKKRTAGSPAPIIKDEPVSPPPFHEVPPLGALRPQPQQQRPVYIDVEPSEDVRYAPMPERRSELPPRQVIYDLERPALPTEARTYSRAGYRTVMREEPDLRRVASLQHARAEAQFDYTEPLTNPPPRSVRAPSYAILDPPPAQAQPRYYDEPVQPTQRRYLPVDDSPTSPAFRESYQSVDPGDRLMAPPQRRIVEDEHGNRYYQSIPQSRAPTMAPPGRRVEYEPYNEVAALRNGSIRAASVLEEAPRERRYVQEMPPPQTAYRRVTEVPRAGTVDRRIYAREEIEDRPPMQRSGSVQVVDYPPPRQATYVDDRPVQREGVMRMSSVRPVASRYEEPREMIQRVQSVRPERELGVYVDERASQMREYIPMERPQYAVTRQARDVGLYEDNEPGRMVLDGTGQRLQRLASRY